MPGQREKSISLKSDGQLKISHLDLLNELDALEKRALELSENQIRVMKLKKSGKSVKEIAWDCSHPFEAGPKEIVSSQLAGLHYRLIPYCKNPSNSPLIPDYLT